MALLPLAVGAVDRGSMQPIVKGEISTSTALLAAPILKILSLAIKHYGIAEEIALVENMVKKNRSRLSIAVLLTTLICSHLTTAYFSFLVYQLIF
jgi:hypothetical protein